MANVTPHSVIYILLHNDLFKAFSKKRYLVQSITMCNCVIVECNLLFGSCYCCVGLWNLTDFLSRLTTWSSNKMCTGLLWQIQFVSRTRTVCDRYRKSSVFLLRTCGHVVSSLINITHSCWERTSSSKHLLTELSLSGTVTPLQLQDCCSVAYTDL